MRGLQSQGRELSERVSEGPDSHYLQRVMVDFWILERTGNPGNRTPEIASRDLESRRFAYLRTLERTGFPGTPVPQTPERIAREDWKRCECLPNRSCCFSYAAI